MSDKPYRRRIYLIKSGLQLRYMGLIIVTMLACSAITGWIIYYNSWSAIALTPNLTLTRLATIFDEVNIKLIKWLLGMTIVIGIVSIFVSHKIAGPVFRFEQATKVVAEGDLTEEIHLRQGDELRDLETDFNKMIVSLRMIVAKDREIIAGLIGIGDKIQSEIEKKDINRDELKKVSQQLHTITAELSTLTAGFKINSDQD